MALNKDLAASALPDARPGAEPDSQLYLPPYWAEAKAELMRRDRIMNKLIPQFGDLQLRGHPDPFTTLARSIVGQQVTVKAAELAWQKLRTLCPKMLPSQVIKAGAAELSACGLSKRKTEYILDLADHFKARRVHADQWSEMDDEAVIAELVRIRGITRWTAEMFLIFNLLRPNVLPLDDAGLIQGISQNYFSGEPVSRSDAREVAANWEPWRTVATWYLWRSLDPISG
jgi:DNA-3-methyladenine glycosylase II